MFVEVKELKMFVGAMVAFCAIAWVGITNAPNPPQASSSIPPADQKAEPNLELIDAKPVREDYGWAIVGHVKNNTRRSYGYVQASFILYDKAGDVQVGSTFANVNNLEPGATWKFTAHVFDKEARSWRFKEVTGF